MSLHRMMSVTACMGPDEPIFSGCNQPKTPGTIVEIGQNRGPLYRILHIHGERVWIEPLSHGAEGIASLGSLRVAQQGDTA